MASDSLSQRKAQLDKAEREHLEDVVADMRERVEQNVEFQLTQKGLDEEPDEPEALDEDIQELVEAIQLEAVDGHTWDEAFAEYVTGVGYTIVNRLAALRTMEVRDFIDEEATVFKENGLTPAAETLVHEEFLLEDEAILTAYQNKCEELGKDIEILFDTDTPYSLVDPDVDTYEDLAGMLDEVPDEVWRADDVLGWVYEYYNRPVVEALDAKNTLEPGDVGPANQFYTPHWVVRMLTDNSLGKLYLEATGKEDTVPEPEALSIDERKERATTPEAAPDVPSIATYLIPDDEDQAAPEFDDPSELRIIDPACGSGHFLLYAFDILERIWWTERPDVPREDVPAKILENNLYGVDIDLRAAQLAAFNLYLKARGRAEAEGADDFQMPNVGIVTADNRVAEIEEAKAVLDDITGEGTDLRDALDEIIETFQTTEALGSLLDVQGTLEEAFDSSKTQSELTDYHEAAHQSLHSFLKALQRAVEEQTSDSFGEQNLRSFLHLLVVLTQDYDVALMNPPYGSRGRMPEEVREYVKSNYKYSPQYYINFFEVGDYLTKDAGRVGMLVPRSFLFSQTFEPFRADFIGKRGSFDFLSEFGYGILDNATVATVGTVVRKSSKQQEIGTFIRLHDVEKSNKETKYLQSAFGVSDDDIQRYFEVEMSEFHSVPGSSICYSLPPEIRKLHDTNLKIDPTVPGIEGEGIGDVKVGLQTGNNDRFIRKQWEIADKQFKPFTNAGGDVWIRPQVDEVINWSENGAQVARSSSAVLRNMDYQTREGLTWAYIKRTGRRFGYYPSGGYFGHASNMLFPEEGVSAWVLLGALNSDLFHSLALSLTPGRKWESGYIGMLPWFRELEDSESIRKKSREQHTLFIEQRVHDFRSPFYIGPELLPNSAASGFFHSNHDHIESITETPEELFNTGDAESSLLELARKAQKSDLTQRKEIEKLAEEIDREVQSITSD
ncbi:BREX-5 system adenine-specific DNA-methyltransferase PglX [Halapricum desulfuricans]|uniref:site-specific DNA-methyltransferase (adenine-specific) n=1 Tax=Halapricum desulfuricans TaxID=2841257 RepID=A0A897N8S0_9EURY|nr:BREX-5 system adenine-specific DNA-methyltransferase PglX [Halapricum desulfuricans]QSG08831.1 Type II restriction enzyme, methylase subunit [Halapricum desulfuricans]